MCFITSRSTRAAFFCAAVLVPLRVGAASFHLPDAVPSPTLAALADYRHSYSGVVLDLGCSADGRSNIDSLWHLTDYGRPTRTFDRGSAYARIDVAQWWRLRAGEWWVGFGSGWIDSYGGNADAAQLWIDLHAAGRSTDSYFPQAHMRKMSVQWYGIGRSFPMDSGDVRGRFELAVRRLVSNSYSELAAAGGVFGETFSGAVTRMQADTPHGRSLGHGWCVDAAAEFENRSWRARLQAEGLAGRMSWQDLAVDAGYLSSPGVFVDSEGFLRDVAGGFAGISSRRSLSGPIDPLVRFHLAQTCRPGLFITVAFRRGETPTTGLGAAWRDRRGREVFFCSYPAARVGELGVGFSRFRCRILSNTWLLRDPRVASVGLSVIMP